MNKLPLEFVNFCHFFLFLPFYIFYFCPRPKYQLTDNLYTTASMQDILIQGVTSFYVISELLVCNSLGISVKIGSEEFTKEVHPKNVVEFRLNKFSMSEEGFISILPLQNLKCRRQKLVFRYLKCSIQTFTYVTF